MSEFISRFATISRIIKGRLYFPRSRVIVGHAFFLFNVELVHFMTIDALSVHIAIAAVIRALIH